MKITKLLLLLSLVLVASSADVFSMKRPRNEVNEDITLESPDTKKLKMIPVQHIAQAYETLKFRLIKQGYLNQVDQKEMKSFKEQIDNQYCQLIIKKSYGNTLSQKEQEDLAVLDMLSYGHAGPFDSENVIKELLFKQNQSVADIIIMINNVSGFLDISEGFTEITFDITNILNALNKCDFNFSGKEDDSDIKVAIEASLQELDGAMGILKRELSKKIITIQKSVQDLRKKFNTYQNVTICTMSKEEKNNAVVKLDLLLDKIFFKVGCQPEEAGNFQLKKQQSPEGSDTKEQMNNNSCIIS